MISFNRYIKSSSKKAVSKYYVTLKKYSTDFNSLSPDAIISISKPDYFEEIENCKETMYKDHFDQMISETGFDKKRLKGHYLTNYLAKYKVTTKGEDDWALFQQFLRESEFNNECDVIHYVRDFRDLDDDEFEAIFIDAYWKFPIRLERNFEVDAIDIPDPSKEELELLYAKRKKEIKKIKIEIENSWN